MDEELEILDITGEQLVQLFKRVEALEAKKPDGNIGFYPRGSWFNWWNTPKTTGVELTFFPHDVVRINQERIATVAELVAIGKALVALGDKYECDTMLASQVLLEELTNHVITSKAGE